MPAARLQTLMPDVFQCDVPVAGGRRLNVEYQGLVGLKPKGSDHVQIVRCGVGGAEVSGLGCQQGVRLFDELGLNSAVQRSQLHQRPGHRGQLLRQCAVGERRDGIGIQRDDVECGELLSSAVANVFAHDYR